MSVSVITYDPDIVAELLDLSAGDAVAMVGEFVPAFLTPIGERPRFMADMEVRALITAYQVAEHRELMNGFNVDPLADGEQFPPTQDGETL
ncbi:hypothetical protein [Thermomonas sp. XSG]|uniref:hypothetical protein n=1 Tax=Thermomonas sp. XSG TaxID=2771436 RepID=UPI00167FEC52|nr:hypothetical protein [Thermomonas sp. XSG]QNU16014.1 hypothetical protein ICG51_002439 [Thermomonas sp. XSG]